MITPVILCGGSGTRLWPLSRKSYPKQFSKLVGDQSLFQASALRVTGAEFANPIVLTNSDFRFIVTEQLMELGIDPASVLIEPQGRNTAPAILAAALYLLAQDEEAMMLVLPSDHNVPDAALFAKTVLRGVDAANAGELVTFGIAPNRPETGYGYLELETVSDDGGAVKLKRFVEKPDEKTAQAMLDAGMFLWNAGIFLFKARSVIEAFQAHRPDMIAPVGEALKTAKSDLGFLRLGAKAWSDAKDISVDYAIMEPAKNLTAVPFVGEWSDLGDWNSVWRESEADENGVVTSGAAQAIDCKDTLLRSEADALELVGIGLKDIVAIAMPDAVLIVDKNRSQDVKLAVEALKARGAVQAVQHPRDHRPWGSFECLYMGDRFQVKRIVVKPGGILSLQSHVHRSEHWIVVEGTAKVTIGDEVKLVGENQSVYIPVGDKHRMENPGKVPMVLIEVQTGSYLGEDDIVRYEDVYARD
ncbi:MAG: mannose-1-phosphate guanylyltransferase/mannose-6-phosphate isomerase [Rhodobacteraceae bacterium]|nr:MAG: mannose-1-phosphate guanylyltransferase/mannose-6-phosphate isomerase [Paracoccaceae bacterium]